MRVCAKYLHRHPSECELSPRALTELMVLDEMEQERLCPKCLRKVRQAALRKECLLCGDEFDDPEIKSLLENG